MFDANLNSTIPESPNSSTTNRKKEPAGEPADSVLVERYRQAKELHGARSEESGLAFEPIFRRYWSFVYSLAVSRMGAVYAEDLAAEAMSTVLERLNGKEVITNLRGLVRHSFEREYASLLEKLFQGKKLMRAGLTSVDAESVASGGARVKGATVVSLNVPTGNHESDDLEMMNLLDDPTADVVEAASRREMIQVLHNLIAQMPSQYRAPLVCQWLMGMRIKEVGEELGLSIDQVKHNTARGIKWLQKRMPGTSADWLL